jgi:hypothetical protein
MLIKSSAALHNKGNTISKLHKEKHKPALPAENAESDLVVSSIEAYQFREEMLGLREKLFTAEANRLAGAKTYSAAEVSERLRELIDGCV